MNEPASAAGLGSLLQPRASSRTCLHKAYHIPGKSEQEADEPLGFSHARVITDH